MATMGFISKAIDRLPRWAQLILMILGLAALIYGIAHEGLIFIVKAIFSPEI